MATEMYDAVKHFQDMALQMGRIEKASKATAENFTDLMYQFQHSHQAGFVDYVGRMIKLPPALKAASAVMRMSGAELQKDVQAAVARLAVVNKNIADQKDLINMSILDGARTDPMALADLQAEVGSLEKEKSIQQSQLDLLSKQYKLKEHLSKITGETVVLETLTVAALVSSYKHSGELNVSLIEANSLLKNRSELTQQVWEVMAATGTAQQSANEAARALVGVGFDLRNNFKSTLEVMVQMRDGLGVSYENSAQMARIFEINLKTPVREVADQITMIKNNTSLAADEATRFATEVGKALRLLGPGAQSSAAKVSGYVTMMAAKMKDVGGSGEDVTKLFNEMTKGTSQGFMLRGLAGVTSPGAVGSVSGSKDAMQGIDRMIKTMVTAGPGSPAYAAQVDMAAQVMGTSTETIWAWQKMIEASNKPLTANQKLQESWNEQMVASSASIRQIKDSFIALVQRGIEPVLTFIKPALDKASEGFRWVASSAYAFVPVMGLVVFGTAKTVVSLGRLTAAIWRVGVAADIAAKRQIAAAASAKAGSGMFSTLKALASFSTRGIGTTMAMAPILTATAIASSAAAGYAVGTYIDKSFPNNWMSKLALLIGKSVYEEDKYKAAGMLQDNQRLSADQLAERVARMSVSGATTPEMLAYIKSNAFRVEALQTQKGAEGLYGKILEKSAPMRERVGQNAYDPNSIETRNKDEGVITALRDIKAVLVDSSKLVDQANKKRNLLLEQSAARAEGAELDAKLDTLTIGSSGNGAPSDPIKSQGRWY
jgi:hypothetical protein